MKGKAGIYIIGAISMIYIIPFIIFQLYKDKPIEPIQNNIIVTVYLTNEDKMIDVGLEEYVIGVVAAEMPATFEEEALKAQAVAARTYVLSKLQINDFIFDTIKHQVYYTDEELHSRWGDNFDKHYNKIKNAVYSTRGEVIAYDKEMIKEPVYFAISNGFTESSEDFWSNPIPYLRSKPSPWDAEAIDGMYTIELSLTTFNNALETEITNNSEIVINEEENTSGKRVGEIRLGNKTLTGRNVMERLSLRSSDFYIDITGSTVKITTHGYGHGVGMSQYGANGAAKEGLTYVDILHYYYHDTEIIKYSQKT